METKTVEVDDYSVQVNMTYLKSMACVKRCAEMARASKDGEPMKSLPIVLEHLEAAIDLDALLEQMGGDAASFEEVMAVAQSAITAAQSKN